MNEHQHDLSDKEFERCMKEFSGKHVSSAPLFDDLLARSAPRIEPLLNRRNTSLLAFAILLSVMICWPRNVGVNPAPVVNENEQASADNLLDFDDCYAAIDQHFQSNEIEPELSDWSTPSDILLTLSFQMNGAKSDVEL